MLITLSYVLSRLVDFWGVYPPTIRLIFPIKPTYTIDLAELSNRARIGFFSQAFRIRNLLGTPNPHSVQPVSESETAPP